MKGYQHFWIQSCPTTHTYWTDEDYAWFFDRARERKAQEEGR